MKQIVGVVALMLAAYVLTAGCSGDQAVMGPDTSRRVLGVAAAQAIPADAVIDSARFYVHVNATDGGSATVHRITGTWDEAVVTWDAFAGAFAADTIAMVTFGDTGWYAVDVTPVVLGWFDSTFETLGFLFQPSGGDTALTIMDSRESGVADPFLEVCYSTHEGSFCDTLDAIADAYIYSADPAAPFGVEMTLSVGAIPGVDSTRQALVRFEFPIEIRYAAIGDRVWLDANENGIQDDGEEGFSGVEVHLFDCEDHLLLSTTSDSEGRYGFDSLLAGDYRLEFVNPFGYVFTHQDVGDDDALDSDVDRYRKHTACFTLMPGQEDLTQDAGLFAFEGCTYGKGYWKNHAGFGPQADELTKLLPVWLGTEGGEWSIEVTNADTAVAILQQHTLGHPSNGITKLYAHLLTAKLNIVNFANPQDVHEAVGAADALLAEYHWTMWDTLDHELRQNVLHYKDASEQYNEGLIGPGHCDGDGCDEE